MSVRPVNFSEGCPVANGVGEVGTTYDNFSWDADLQGFVILFDDKSDPEKKTRDIHVAPTGDIDSSMPSATAEYILDRVRHCSGTCPVRVKRLGGILGSKTVTGCGAFPDQNPKRINVNAESSGWFNPIDFD